MKKIIISSILIVVIVSCVPTYRFSKIVSEDEIYFDTVQQLNNINKHQAQLIDSLNDALVSQQMSYSENIHEIEKKLAEKEKELERNRETLDELKKIVGLQQQAVYNLKQQVCDALKCFTPEELNVEVKNGKLYVSLSDKLLFPSGSDKVDHRGIDAISRLSGVLKESDMEIMIEGHTDTVPILNTRNKDNWDLSAHRATSVARLFSENGIRPDRLIAAGRSKYLPVSDNQSEVGRQLNRRTEIVLAPKLDKLWELTESDNLADYSENIPGL